VSHDRADDPRPLTPRFTLRQAPARVPTCGTATPAGRCPQDATWHVLWTAPGPDGHAPATLLCDTHLNSTAPDNAWFERHRATTACSSPGQTWHYGSDSHCTPEPPMNNTPGRATDGPVHAWFGLSYSTYQVLPRTLMQSMPPQWQQRMVACLRELSDAFEHVPQPEVYAVEAGEQLLVSELTDAQMRQLGITYDEYDDEPPDGLDNEALEAWQDAHRIPEPLYHDRDGQEMDASSYVIVPTYDPVPHYNRGRTYIPPGAPESTGGQAPIDTEDSAPEEDTPAAADTCEVLDLPTGPARVIGSGRMTPTDRQFLNEVILAAQARYAHEHPELSGPVVQRWFLQVQNPDGTWRTESVRDTDRTRLVGLLEQRRQRAARSSDGTPAQHRLIRETIRYDVEDALAPSARHDTPLPETS
jgi:hypothetical protein